MRVDVGTSLREYRVAAAPSQAVTVLSVGLACCAMEFDSAVRLGLLRPAADGDPVADGSVLLVSGTVTDVLVPAVREVLGSLPAGARVVAFGACASTGGPYWDAPTVLKGVDQLVPVARYVPGCPPSPHALLAALASFLAPVTA